MPSTTAIRNECGILLFANGEPHVIEVSIDFALFEQLLMRSRADEFTLTEDQDLVCRAQRAQPFR